MNGAGVAEWCITSVYPPQHIVTRHNVEKQTLYIHTGKSLVLYSVMIIVYCAMQYTKSGEV